MKIVTPKELLVFQNHRLNFRLGQRKYSFVCDENGKVKPRMLRTPLHVEMYLKCIAEGEGEHETWEVRDYSPAIGECSCGERVTLSSFTNTCSCGVDYNMSGQQLACRSQWGEETGEHWSDCY
jgi:hypothetical protein